MKKYVEPRRLTKFISKTSCTLLASLFFSTVFTGCSLTNSLDRLRETNQTPQSGSHSSEEEEIEYAFSSPTILSYEPQFKFEYYNLLSEHQKKLYNAVSNFSWELTYLYSYEYDKSDDFKINEKTKLFYAFDHPESELLNLELGCDFSYGLNRWYIQQHFYSKDNYTVAKSQEQYNFILNEIDAVISNLVDEVNRESNIVGKYHLIYDWIIQNVDYDFVDMKYQGTLSPDSHNIYGAIVKKQAVCDGISDAFKYICNKCNLECLTIRGYVNNTISPECYHQWNIIPINNRWFLVDCTLDLKSLDKYEKIKSDNLSTYHFMCEDLCEYGRIQKYEEVYTFIK